MAEKPKLSYFEALKLWNAGSTSWCIPRRDTVGAVAIMKLRRGEKTDTPKEIIDKLERKTVGKAKKEKKSMTVKI